MLSVQALLVARRCELPTPRRLRAASLKFASAIDPTDAFFRFRLPRVDKEEEAAFSARSDKSHSVTWTRIGAELPHVGAKIE